MRVADRSSWLRRCSCAFANPAPVGNRPCAARIRPPATAAHDGRRRRHPWPCPWERPWERPRPWEHPPVYYISSGGFRLKENYM